MVGQYPKSHLQVILSWVEKTVAFNEGFIKSYNDENDEGCFFKGDIQYVENLHNPHNDFRFFPERTKIEKIGKLVTNLHDQEKYVIHIRNLKQTLNHKCD